MKHNAKKSQVGVWLDHSQAHFIKYSQENSFLAETIESPYKRIKRDDGESSDSTKFGANPQYSSDNENRKNNIALNELSEYFKMLEAKLSEYDEILLFGPSTAKDQLMNRISSKKAFEKKTIYVKNSDKKTNKQLLAFVRDFFKH